MGMLSRILGPPSGAVYDRDPMFGAIQLSCWGVGTYSRGCPRLAEELPNRNLRRVLDVGVEMWRYISDLKPLSRNLSLIPKL